MYGLRGEAAYSLASEIKLLKPEEIEENASKQILLGFNTASQDMIVKKDESDKEVPFSEEEQNARKEKIFSMTKRFLQEIYKKLNLDAKDFEPTIEEIMQEFKNTPKTIEFEKIVETKINSLTNEQFTTAHANYYSMMTSRIHYLYNHINNHTLYYNFSLINDNNKKGGYFASKPEMLARSAECYFFDKYPETNITPPEWWENNSYLFYPQDEEKQMIIDIFSKTVASISQNSLAFEANLGRKNVKKQYRL